MNRSLSELAEAIYQTVKGTQFVPQLTEIEWFKVAQACRDAAPGSARPEGADTARLEWLFSVLDDRELSRKFKAVGDVYAGGSMHGIRLKDWRHALDVAMQQYVDKCGPQSGSAK